MCRAQRLQSARSTGWVQNYPGKNLVRGYKKWFGVDELCAVRELRELGVKISEEREAELRQTVAVRGAAKAERARRRREKENVEEEVLTDVEATFAFIAGYTPWGFPYGITWEEMKEIEEGRENHRVWDDGEERF